jgi:ubiquinone/menaquinone biosynthesis C-methylase UbiE
MMATTAEPVAPAARPDLDPEYIDIGRHIIAYRSAKIIFTAARLDLFTFLEPRSRTLNEICAALKIKPRPAEIFLHALGALGFIGKANGAYANAPRASRFLVRGKPEYCGPILKFQDVLWPAWGELDHVLHEGSPRKNLGHWMKKSSDFTKEYIHCMSRISRQPAREVAAALVRPEDRRLLDVGAGPGIFTLAMLERNSRLKATLLDLPVTLRLTKASLACRPERGRILLQAGDYRALRLAPNSFDIILLSHITHNEGVDFNRKLLAQCFAALRPRGRIAVHDFTIEEAGAAQLFPALSSIHMMLYTEEGAVYRAEQYQSWMREAGLSDLRQEAICGDSATPSVLLVGAKA